MNLKTLACISMAACGLMFSATDAPAQSWWNPLNAFSKPAYNTNTYGSGYGTYNSGMNCANGVCTPKPVYNAAYCPNGKCGVSQCGPNGCGVNSTGYGANYRTPSYLPVAPAYRTTPGYFDTHRLPAARPINYRPQPVGSNRVNPFYR